MDSQKFGATNVLWSSPPEIFPGSVEKKTIMVIIGVRKKLPATLRLSQFSRLYWNTLGPQKLCQNGVRPRSFDRCRGIDSSYLSGNDDGTGGSDGSLDSGLMAYWTPEIGNKQPMRFAKLSSVGATFDALLKRFEYVFVSIGDDASSSFPCLAQTLSCFVSHFRVDLLKFGNT